MRVSKHAVKRVKERTGLKKKLAEKLLVRALEEGIEHEKTKGSLRNYLDHLYFKNEEANNIIVYNRWVFICSDKVFITILALPNKLIRIADTLQKKLNEELENEK